MAAGGGALPLADRLFWAARRSPDPRSSGPARRETARGRRADAVRPGGGRPRRPGAAIPVAVHRPGPPRRRGDPRPPARPRGSDALETIVAAVRDVPGVAGTLSSLDSGDSVFVGKERRLSRRRRPRRRLQNPVEDLLPRLRETSATLAAGSARRIRRPGSAGRARLPLNFDLRLASAVDARSAETRVLPVTLILLLLAFGSVVAAVLPLGVGILSIALSLGVAAFLARFFTLSILIQSLSSMIGLGLGIDYALLTVSRFRESLAAGQAARPGGGGDGAARRLDDSAFGLPGFDRLCRAADDPALGAALRRPRRPARHGVLARCCP